MARKRALWLVLVEDLVIQANTDGSTRQFIVTPEKYRALGLDLDELLACVRINDIDTNAGVTTKQQFSFDGQNWTDASSAVISEKTATGDYCGSNTTSTELMPYVRTAVVIRDTVGTDGLTARISVWAYYKYRG